MIIVAIAACSSPAAAPSQSPPPNPPAVATAPPRIFVAPDRVCVDHGALVVERDNECRELTCTATAAAAIDVALWKTDRRACKDSGTVHARCALPRGSRASINHGDAFALPAAGSCRAYPNHALAAAPAGGALWPDRVRLDGGALELDNDCGCGEALECTIDATTPGTLAVTLRKSKQFKGCNDCYPMDPARCALPPRSTTLHVVINGHAAFDLPADAGDRTVWSRRP